MQESKEDFDARYAKLWMAELRYLTASGWSMLCGVSEDNIYIHPKDAYPNKPSVYYTHEEALKIQKEKDNEYITSSKTKTT